ncbi:methyltransferase [Virgisporangium aliadipatigenens]|uniref:Methyltransferase n=1 Tax=Virgisporangium aliadipatigenens TaxID=741659 RepID=A0A8J3YKG4_9ACTN|nr:class I SAM-dependent methyltransferase [Virgisporangium aliadipatigenens]GIJ45952.1 methyltransferase [Virgisporangium aliadipatigenens]
MIDPLTGASGAAASGVPAHVTATRESYDRVAVDYAALLEDELAGKPLDRALLTTFAEQVGDGRVADVGCGPGRITRFLRDLGADVEGIDLSPGMVAEARRRHPDLPFRVGSAEALDIGDGALGGVLAWYSIIHTPTEGLPAVLAEFRRVLRPGGQLLMAFQAGDEPRDLDRAYGHPVALRVHRRGPQLVERMLDDAGLTVHTRVLREPAGTMESSAQAYLMAVR